MEGLKILSGFITEKCSDLRVPTFSQMKVLGREYIVEKSIARERRSYKKPRFTKVDGVASNPLPISERFSVTPVAPAPERFDKELETIQMAGLANEWIEALKTIVNEVQAWKPECFAIRLRILEYIMMYQLDMLLEISWITTVDTLIAPLFISAPNYKTIRKTILLLVGLDDVHPFLFLLSRFNDLHRHQPSASALGLRTGSLVRNQDFMDILLFLTDGNNKPFTIDNWKNIIKRLDDPNLPPYYHTSFYTLWEPVRSEPTDLVKGCLLKGRILCGFVKSQEEWDEELKQLGQKGRVRGRRRKEGADNSNKKDHGPVSYETTFVESKPNNKRKAQDEEKIEQREKSNERYEFVTPSSGNSAAVEAGAGKEKRGRPPKQSPSSTSNDSVVNGHYLPPEEKDAYNYKMQNLSRENSEEEEATMNLDAYDLPGDDHFLELNGSMNKTLPETKKGTNSENIAAQSHLPHYSIVNNTTLPSINDTSSSSGNEQSEESLRIPFPRNSSANNYSYQSVVKTFVNAAASMSTLLTTCNSSR